MKIPCYFGNIVRFIFPKIGLRYGSNLRIARDCFFDKAKSVEFGNNVFVNRKCQFHIGQEDAKIVIGSSVWIGMDVCFICPTHEIGDGAKRAGRSIYKSINIGDGCWIGARSTILPGVSIGKGTIVAAGSVVNKSIGENELWGGVPVKLIKQLKS